MFTGIVQALADVSQVTEEGSLRRLTIELSELAAGLQLGASVAVNGVCLTVTDIAQSAVSFDVIAETLRLTNLQTVVAGDQVNVERSFTTGTEVGGHIVSGHVSGMGELVERRVEGHDHVVRLGFNAEQMKYIFHKGFVAVDGASLTVSAVDREAGWFEISLIPETLARTTLGSRGTGEQFNVEVEAQTVTTVDTVERLLSDPAWIKRVKAAV